MNSTSVPEYFPHAKLLSFLGVLSGQRWHFNIFSMWIVHQCLRISHMQSFCPFLQSCRYKNDIWIFSLCEQYISAWVFPTCEAFVFSCSLVRTRMTFERFLSANSTSVPEYFPHGKLFSFLAVLSGQRWHLNIFSLWIVHQCLSISHMQSFCPLL